MRICHIIVGTDVGGAEQSLRRLLLQSKTERQDYLVVSITTIGSVGQSLRDAGIRVEALGLAGLADVLPAFVKLRRLLREFAPDIVQTWMYHADLFGGLAARSVGIDRVVWGIRNTLVPSETRQQRLISRTCAALSWWLPKSIVCVAHASIQPYVEAGYDPSKMVVIGNGLDFGPFDRVLDASQMGSSTIETVTVTCIGRLHADKGQDLLLQAAARVATEKDVTFLFVGRDCSMDNPAFAKLVRDARVHHRIIAVGERSDVAEILARTTVFCLPSRTEGFPNALAEAMAMNRPCVAADVGDAAAVLGPTGILVPAQQPAKLAEALDRLLAMKATDRNTMGAASGQRVRSHFSIQTVLMRYSDLYKRISGGLV